MYIVQVAAVADNGVMGQHGRLPWRINSELAHFRNVTLHKPIIMGRITFLAIGKPLPRRTNIVISRDQNFTAPATLVACTITTALDAARGDALRRGTNEIIIIGGADIYRQTLPLVDRLLISRVHLRPEGDTIFPHIDPALFRETSRTAYARRPDEPAGFTISVYDRIAPGAPV